VRLKKYLYMLRSRQTFHNQYLHSQVCFYDSYITHSSDHMFLSMNIILIIHTISSAGYVRISKEEKTF